jgi:hypothetical protein
VATNNPKIRMTLQPTKRTNKTASEKLKGSSALSPKRQTSNRNIEPFPETRLSQLDYDGFPSTSSTLTSSKTKAQHQCLDFDGCPCQPTPILAPSEFKKDLEPAPAQARKKRRKERGDARSTSRPRRARASYSSSPSSRRERTAS